MDNIKNNTKEEILKTIMAYKFYTPKTRELLALYYRTTVKGISYISYERISQELMVSSTTAIKATGILREDGFITGVKAKRCKNNSYIVNEDKLNDLVEIYRLSYG
jgi:DNA-binding Lrp family transcriptional regulator